MLNQLIGQIVRCKAKMYTQTQRTFENYIHISQGQRSKNKIITGKEKKHLGRVTKENMNNEFDNTRYYDTNITHIEGVKTSYHRSFPLKYLAR